MKAFQQRFTGVLSLVIMITITITGTACVASPTAKSPVSVQLDWPKFIARQDLIWETLPTHFDYGAFMGNGMLGSMIYQDGPQRLRWEMGRSDVTEHRRDNARLPIGGLVLTTMGKIADGLESITANTPAAVFNQRSCENCGGSESIICSMWAEAQTHGVTHLQSGRIENNSINSLGVKPSILYDIVIRPGCASTSVPARRI